MVTIATVYDVVVIQLRLKNPPTCGESQKAMLNKSYDRTGSIEIDKLPEKANDYGTKQSVSDEVNHVTSASEQKEEKAPKGCYCTFSVYVCVVVVS